jgi:hypothetical protein
MPSGKSVSVKWESSNPKIAKVSQSGKVTAVAPGTVFVDVYSEDYNYVWDQCWVTVPGGAKDPKPLGLNDWIYYYGKTKLTAPASKYYEALIKIQKSIGGYLFVYGGSDAYLTGLLYGSKNYYNAHTFIYIEGDEENADGFGISACGKSPIKTSRGIMVGAKKSTVQQKYGLPSHIYNYNL